MRRAIRQILLCAGTLTLSFLLASCDVTPRELPQDEIDRLLELAKASVAYSGQSSIDPALLVPEEKFYNARLKQYQFIYRAIDDRLERNTCVTITLMSGLGPGYNVSIADGIYPPSDIHRDAAEKFFGRK